MVERLNKITLIRVADCLTKVKKKNYNFFLILLSVAMSMPR